MEPGPVSAPQSPSSFFSAIRRCWKRRSAAIPPPGWARRRRSRRRARAMRRWPAYRQTRRARSSGRSAPPLRNRLRSSRSPTPWKMLAVARLRARAEGAARPGESLTTEAGVPMVLTAAEPAGPPAPGAAGSGRCLLGDGSGSQVRGGGPLRSVCRRPRLAPHPGPLRAEPAGALGAGALAGLPLAPHQPGARPGTGCGALRSCHWHHGSQGQAEKLLQPAGLQPALPVQCLPERLHLRGHHCLPVPLLRALLPVAALPGPARHHLRPRATRLPFSAADRTQPAFGMKRPCRPIPSWLTALQFLQRLLHRRTDRQRPSRSTASPAAHRGSVDTQPLHRPFSQPSTDVERFVAPSHPEPLNQP